MTLDYRGARKHALRTVSYARVAKRSDFLVAPFGRGSLLVDANDQEIGRSVYINGEYERTYMQVALQYLEQEHGFSPAQKVFVDIGANIGTSTVDALLHFGFAQAVCFEPDPHNFRMLKINLLLNGLEDRATPLPLALGNIDGSALLRVSTDNSGDHRISEIDEGHHHDNPGHKIVSCSRLDNQVAAGAVDLARVGLVWIDTQGHEPFVLQGASELLSADIPVVIEYWPEALEEIGALETLENLVTHNYSTAIDLRLLRHGLNEEAVSAAGDIRSLRSRYRSDELTDLLLMKSRPPVHGQ